MILSEALQQLASNPTAPLDLAELALLVAQDEYAHLDVAGYLSEIDGMAHEARAYLGGGLEARTRGLCRYLFHEMGFHGNTQDYYDPRNSYLNDVIDLRTGLPITLSIIAMSVGRRAGLEVVGVGLPAHFIVKAVTQSGELLFDPFHGGRLLSPEQCEVLVQQATGKPFVLEAAHLQVAPPGAIVERMLTNLKGVHLRRGDYERVIRVTERLCQLTPDDISQHRDLGLSWLQLGQPGKAIDPLEAYLAALPEGDDAEATRRVLRQARDKVAQWN